MSAIELIWLYHRNTISYMAQERKSQMRKYLVQTGDIQLLRAWDAGQFGAEHDG